MTHGVNDIIRKVDFSREEINTLLDRRGNQADDLFRRAREVQLANVGNKVSLRGLIEISNVCNKNCFYCGIRKDNKAVRRYSMPVAEVVETAHRAMEQGFASLVIQSGELQDRAFTGRITRILEAVSRISDGRMAITLSCGEQSPEIYREWKEAGARRYLLRIGTSTRALYRNIHPWSGNHCFDTRLRTLASIQDSGYQTGTGVMIGLPSQSIEDLADDLLFMRDLDIDMVGMGPYIEHPDTPLYGQCNSLWSPSKRFFMTRKMVAVLRILMPDINIAATTGSEAILPQSREILISSGANVIMPNLTPRKYIGSYTLYRKKPDSGYNDAGRFDAFRQRVKDRGYRIVWGEAGDPLHYRERITSLPR
jgi:biotin synthase